jgi:hypothetical protein
VGAFEHPQEGALGDVVGLRRSDPARGERQDDRPGERENAIEGDPIAVGEAGERPVELALAGRARLRDLRIR